MCETCKDTGYIETGNNDLPCYCEKGDDAMFNKAGFALQVSGKFLKELQRLKRGY